LHLFAKKGDAAWLSTTTQALAASVFRPGLLQAFHARAPIRMAGKRIEIFMDCG